ncbi:hypothetical protein AB0D08_39135 [Kitasatospora sp. NPDC048540]|uniref:hypothetical protein n=1 Tax=unclassified Kitasatospora TaxID=2633591 RepID=UPI00068D8F06|nr:hypothetical protein [Kitasatospora sp. MBT63]
MNDQPKYASDAAAPSAVQAYTRAPALAHELYDLLHCVAALHRPSGQDQDERILLVRQAALADRCRLADTSSDDDGAGWLAWRLHTFDKSFDTSRGPIPASDERWDRDRFGYVRQEYHWWITHNPGAAVTAR